MAKLDWYIRANLKPRHLQLLVALHELHRVGRVATYLNISQPAVSKTLAELESGLELRLFDRIPTGLRPTVYGECLIRLARSILRDFDLTGNELLQLKAGMIGKVRVGVLPVAAPVLVPQAVIRFAKAAPEIAVSLYEGNSDQLLPLLRDGQLELVVGNLPSASKSIALQLKELLPGEPVVAVCGLRHALANKTEVSAFDLANYPVVIPPSGVIFRDAVAAAMDALGIPIRGGTIESGSMTATNTFVRDTDAISFYSEHLAKHYLRLGMVKILPISTSVLTSPIGVVWSKNIDVSVATQLIIKNLSLVANSLSR